MGDIDLQYFAILDKFVDMQKYFTGIAWVIAQIVTLICILWTVIKYVINGEGLKEAVVKLVLAYIVFIVVIHSYPSIISGASALVYKMARSSTWDGSMQDNFEYQKTQTITIVSYGNDQSIPDGGQIVKRDYVGGKTILTVQVPQGEKVNYFTDLLQTKSGFSTLSPAATMQIIMHAALDALDYATNVGGITNLSALFTGFFVAFAIIITGIFGVLNYFICFLEYMLVTAIGVIMLPFMLWDGTKFLSEKLIGAMVGFFIKLLVCNICVFIMLWGFLGLVPTDPGKVFKGSIDQIVGTLFACFFYFVLCKQGPELATSLLTGSPQLSGGGAMAAVGGAIGGAVGFLSGAKNMARAGAGAIARPAFASAGALSQARSAADGVGQLGGTRGARTGAFFSSLGAQARESVFAKGDNLMHSITGAPSGGISKHDSGASFNQTDRDGFRQTTGEHMQGRRNEGQNDALKYAIKHNI
jgi:hypothetical protein